MNKKYLLELITYVSFIIKLCSAGPLSIYEQKKYHKQIEAQGLYDANDKVTILTQRIFRDIVFDQEYASIVEFYNAYCGFCKRFAPKYKEFAADVYAWQGVAQVAAIDCASDENHDLCREFEVMGYPSLRYFKPHFKEEPNSFGLLADGEDKDGLRTNLLEHIKNETNVPAHWPNLQPLQDENIDHLFNDVSNTVEFIFLIYNFDNTNVPAEVILDVYSHKRIAVKVIDSFLIAKSFGLSLYETLAVVTRKLELINLPIHKHNRIELCTVIEKFVARRGIASRKNSSKVQTVPAKESVPVIQDVASAEDIFPHPQDAATIQVVKSMGPAIFQADLEQAIRFTLFHEIPQFAEISGDRLLALQRYINLLQR